LITHPHPAVEVAEGAAHAVAAALPQQGDLTAGVAAGQIDDQLLLLAAELMQAALARLQTLLHLSGGIYFGDNLEAQLQLCSPTAKVRAQALTTLRFCCQSWSFAFIREGLQRYPIEHTRYSKPLAGDTWWHHPKAPHVLDPGSAADSHPYPVELDLPSWTVEHDVDLRNWLFGFGAGIRIEAPAALLEEHRSRALATAEIYL
jgi:hypothetical protein